MNVKVNLSPAANQFNTPTQPLASKSKQNGSFLNVGDETTKVGKEDMGTFAERLAESFKTDNAEIIRALDELSAQDKMEIAMRSYLQMQGRIISVSGKEESDIRKFRDLESEKAYYNRLLDESKDKGYAEIGEDQYNHYRFSDDAPGSRVSTRDIEEALDDVQGRIDDMIDPTRTFGGDRKLFDLANQQITKDYIAYGEAFKEVTGLEGDCLDPGDSLMWHKLDRTEDNFIEKAYENLDKLKGMSKDLYELMKKYKDEQVTEIGGGDLSEEARTRMEAFDYVREQFVYGNRETEIKTLGLLNTQA